MKSHSCDSRAKWKWWLAFLAATIFAIVLRLPLLEQRPMHGDEAVHAIKFGDLLEEGVYRYDPREYHGPTLNYLSLLPAWLGGAEKLTQVTEFTLRIVPVFFGVVLVLLPLLIVRGISRTAAFCAAVLTAVSPAMVFYSRYYVMGILLVCFTFAAIACGYRYTLNRRAGWALLTGVFIGLMHATKETCVIAFGAMAAALLFTALLERRGVRYVFRAVRPAHLVLGFVAAAVVSILFYSSFFTNPGGVADSFRTYATYFDRAGHGALHINHWYYYLKMLLYSRYGAGAPAWSEASIVLLAIAGFVVAVTKRGLPVPDGRPARFIAFFTLAMTVIYSLIPYKTPWCLLGFLHGMILLAGIAAAAMIRLAPILLCRLAVAVLLLASCGHLAWQAYMGSYKYDADPRNPYVYAHPTKDVLTMVQKVQEMAQVHQDGHNMYVQVICPPSEYCPGPDYWPLPWYLRSFSKVGYWDHIDMGQESAPVIIASVSVESELARKLYIETPFEKRQMYMYLFDKPYYLELRPGVRLLGFVRKDLYDRWRQQEAEAARPGQP